MNFEDAKDRYLDHLRIERGLSGHTISAYSRDLQRFSHFLNIRKLTFTSISAQDVLDYQVSLKELNLSVPTINRHLSALRSFYKYAGMEFGLSDPTVEIASNFLARKLPKALTIEEISELIASTYREGDPISFRDNALLELLYSSGARVSEIIALNVNDILSQDSAEANIAVVKVRGKGSKERLVPLGSYALKAVDTYLTRTRPALVAHSVKSEPALFVNSRGKRLSRQSAWQIVMDAARRCDLSGKVSPHVFRHSFATHLLDGGADIRVVQELLGHASVTTTQIYTLVTIDKVRQAYALAHPRAR